MQALHTELFPVHLGTIAELYGTYLTRPTEMNIENHNV